MPGVLEPQIRYRRKIRFVINFSCSWWEKFKYIKYEDWWWTWLLIRNQSLYRIAAQILHVFFGLRALLHDEVNPRKPLATIHHMKLQILKSKLHSNACIGLGYIRMTSFRPMPWHAYRSKTKCLFKELKSILCINGKLYYFCWWAWSLLYVSSSVHAVSIQLGVSVSSRMKSTLLPAF